MPISRRQFVLDTALGTVSLGYARWGPLSRAIRGPEDGRLTARPAGAPKDPLTPGLHTLSVVNGRKTVVMIPSSLDAAHPAPLVLMLHGATEDSDLSIDALRESAERTGTVVLAPSSAGVTWDAIRGVFADDFSDIDQQLERVFEHCAIDPHRLAIAGFSDGASYAISLGLINGDLFTHLIAYSPGFIIPGKPYGHPQVFIAHGTRDRILPIERCGQRIASELKAAGYVVEFDTFDGPHMIRPEMVDQSMRWFTGHHS